MAKGKVKGAWINSPQAEAVAEYYVQGHSVAETSERFGVSKGQVNNLAKLRGLTNGRNFRTARAEDMKREAERRLAEHVAGMGFKYIGGYSDKNGKATVECCKCGARFDRTVDFIWRHGVSCPECKKAETAKQQAENAKRQAERKKNEAEIRTLEKEWFRLLNPPRDFYAEQHEAFLDRSGICEVCGKAYTVREYVESCGLKKAQDGGVCSAECRRLKKRREERESRKRRGVNDNDRHRAKKYGCAYDPSITLKKLVERDGLRCAICGGMCDWNDLTYSGHCGPTYPSKDHIIPLAKGGTHTWDNMQVAHHICNSLKGDRLEEVLHDAG